MSVIMSILSILISVVTFIENSVQLSLLSGISVNGLLVPKLKLVSASTLVQFSARETAAPASTTPNPYL